MAIVMFKCNCPPQRVVLLPGELREHLVLDHVVGHAAERR